ncbi:hypothetical protein K431DRAFT_294536 [Polychaeton citri CBS 116435]|uniref:Uncharacterized protein n=1 Tax=Polychaeton citri CBS 116435 TaxID=1314669 RepID=A0A9P4Q9V4_9PEZI|nr:hypothetical protein K431DRAFT_294536 [Polychaeton citri CBS 116435]
MLEYFSQLVTIDLSSVASQRVGDLKAKIHLLDDAASSIKRRLEQEVGKTFLWVSLVCDKLKSYNRYYDDSINRVIDSNPNRANASEEGAAFTKVILQVLMALSHPLTLDELNPAISVREPYKRLLDLSIDANFETTLKRCCSLMLRITRYNWTFFLLLQKLQFPPGQVKKGLLPSTKRKSHSHASV